MFVQNQIGDLPDHKTVITDALSRAGEVRFVVAYVKENGVNMILDSVRGKPAKLLCSLDMGITQLSGIGKLIENGVEVSVYAGTRGTFHPKVWLFKTGNKWSALIGSANLTGAALVDNVEASVLLDDPAIVNNAVMFFSYLWESGNSTPMSGADVAKLQEQLNRRRGIRARVSAPAADDSEKIQTLFSFIKGWIDISKWEQKGISSLWRGWYIIPDHGYVNDELIGNLAAYMSAIGDNMHISGSSPSSRYVKFLKMFMERSRFQREHLKSSPHALFVRQAKNYLIKFGWADHPLVKSGGKYKAAKDILISTALGRRIAACRSTEEIRALYSEYFEEYLFNGLGIVSFTRRLLERLDGRLDLNEFDYFVVHAYNEDDMETIVEMIRLYRDCTEAGRRELGGMVKRYFAEIKEPTAKNVRSNYVKNVKHTMSAIAWCSGFYMTCDFVIGLESNAD